MQRELDRRQGGAEALARATAEVDRLVGEAAGAAKELELAHARQAVLEGSLFAAQVGWGWG